MNCVGSGTDSESFESNSQQGFTLVELMIAMTIGLILLLVVGTVFTSSRQIFRIQEDNARIQESGRFALEILGRSVKQAGLAEIPFTGLKIGFTGMAITGIDGAPGVADTLTVQYDGATGDRDCQFGTAVTAANYLAGNNIIQSHFNLDAANAQLQCAGAIGAAPPAPGATPVGIVLLENIEDFQVLYGIDTTGDQSVNQYVSLPADWNQVVTTRVCVLIRSDQTNIVPIGSNYLNCNGAAVAVLADRRLRRAFTATFNLRNRVNNLP
ncbi:MAG: type IV pilus assembly protein PilW [Candidatus Nitrotoga sp. LAW]|nr:MAG: type IV pilus assembly protein PilW [Candidatus Nitrotoga sp. LAW]